MIHTRYRPRHYRPDPETGKPSLIWAHGLGEFPLGEILRGSKRDIEVYRCMPWAENALADEGEKDILDVYFDDVAVRASLWLSLYNDTPVETDTLATLVNETSGTGYGRIELVRGTDWSDPALDAGDMQTITPTKTFNATGTWTDATQLVLGTVSTGTAGLFLAWAALSATRTLVSGDSLATTLAVKLA